MIKLLLVIALSIFLFLCQQNTVKPVDEISTDKNLNILLIMVDDMGWTDIGPYGSEICTPNLDKLADRGALFTDFHTSLSCSPTRSMLLSGTDNHLAGLGNMGELLAPNQIGHPGYEGHLNANVMSLAEVLKDAGYHTYMAGKWHLGHDLDTIPGARGFERSLSLLYGGASHFNDMSGLMEIENPAKYSMNGDFIDSLPEEFYSTRSYTDFLINAIREYKNDDKPFFAYLAYTAPHDPLQVPEPWMSKYEGTYDDGYEVLRENRIANTKALNLIPKNAKVPRLHPAITRWETLSAEEKAFESKQMEVYSGMIENVDYHIGRMLSFLGDIQELDNTIVLFTSDNGSNPWYNIQYPGNEDGVYLGRFDNRTENLGNPTSHTAYGIGWASACSGPLDYFKMAVGEGGIRTPLIFAGPNIAPGKTFRSFAYVTDIFPTLLDMVKVDRPGTYNGNKLHPITGRSLLKVLSGESESAYGPDDYIAGEMLNHKWIRKGNYKAELVTKPYGPEVWQLYDLSLDPDETTDLAEEYPELLVELKAAWAKYAAFVHAVAPHSNRCRLVHLCCQESLCPQTTLHVQRRTYMYTGN